MKKKIGIIGFGSVGQFLADKILTDSRISEKLELSFVWNRTESKLDALEPKYRLLGENFGEAFLDFISKNEKPDIIVELAHYTLIEEFGPMILEHCHLFMTTITAFAHESIDKALKSGMGDHAIYLPSGAAWGIDDIVKMDSSGSIKQVKLSMYFNAKALKLSPSYDDTLQQFLESSNDEQEILIAKGTVRELALIAPNNVNTMCCVALAAKSQGLDNCIAYLFARKSHDAHVTEIEIRGADGFIVKTQRINPAKKTAVTGAQTYYSFLESLLKCNGEESGIVFV